MLVLALDTTTRSGSLALVRDDEVLRVVTGDPARTHAERLPADIVRLLDSAGVTLSAVDVFGVAAGPGSFTGLRIGIAAVQGLAFALKRPVVGVSCLDALASIAREAASKGSTWQHPLVAAWMDAQRSEVFAALYEVEPDFAPRLEPGRPTPEPARSRAAEEGLPGSAAPEERSDGWRIIDGPVSERPETVLQRWRTISAGRDVVVAGDGVSRYRSLLVEHLGDHLHAVDPLPPLAPVIGRMAARAAATGLAVAPHAVRPIYVRRPDAELARDRQNAAPSRDSGDA